MTGVRCNVRDVLGKREQDVYAYQVGRRQPSPIPRKPPTLQLLVQAAFYSCLCIFLK